MLSQTRTLLIFGMKKNFAMPSKAEWTEVPRNLLFRHPDGYVLLTDQAFVAFLPAWLMCSLEGMDEENEVRNFLAYTFSNTLRQFRLLNLEQRLIVRSILAEFSQRGTGSFVRDLLAKTIVFIDSLDNHPTRPTKLT